MVAFSDIDYGWHIYLDRAFTNLVCVHIVVRREPSRILYGTTRHCCKDLHCKLLKCWKLNDCNERVV